MTDIRDHKYLNPECGESGCQWLVAEHQIEVYRKQMAEAEARAEKYGAELDRVAALLETVHPIGKVRGIGRLQVACALEEVLKDIAELLAMHQKLESMTLVCPAESG